ncbi:MAG TPA: hypothetical protein VK179_12605 [Bacteroidales bacterium]|nr:hypothetical protein [Bacteroidales bacterium]
MSDYLRRFIKFILYMAVIFTVVLVVVPLLTHEKPTVNFFEAFTDKHYMPLTILIVVYSFLYPLVAFTRVKRHLNGTFAENRAVFEKVLENLQYVKTIDSPDKIVYRKKSGFARFAQWWEDGVVILPNENPVILSGLRKSVARVDRMIDRELMKNE